MIKIKVSEYSTTPGGRYISDGKYSGEDFRTSVLLPKYEEALENKDTILVDLDDCYGMPTSFLEEAFGGLVRIKKSRKIAEILQIKSEDRPDLVEKVRGYIRDAEVK